MKQVIQQLKAARKKAWKEFSACTEALNILGWSNNGNSAKPRKLSAKARKAIGDAQRRRWAKVRRAKKG
jgi:hypothetical protein